jgi:hypothetical protein
VLNIQFEHNTPNPNCLAWTAGTIIYTNNAGVETFVNTIAGGGANVFYAGQPVYIFWLQGEGFLRATNDLAAATGPNSVCLATYTGGSSLYSTYGRTVIDGDQIKTGAVTAAKIAAGAISANKIVTGAITADKVAAGAITADKISVTSLSAISANFGTITVQRLNLPGGVIDTGRLAPGAVTGDIYYNNYQFPQDIPQAGVTTPPVVTSPPPPPPPAAATTSETTRALPWSLFRRRTPTSPASNRGGVARLQHRPALAVFHPEQRLRRRQRQHVRGSERQHGQLHRRMARAVLPRPHPGRSA